MSLAGTFAVSLSLVSLSALYCVLKRQKSVFSPHTNWVFCAVSAETYQTPTYLWTSRELLQPSFFKIFLETHKNICFQLLSLPVVLFCRRPRWRTWRHGWTAAWSKATPTLWQTYGKCGSATDCWPSSNRRSCTWSAWGTPGERRNGVVPGATGNYNTAPSRQGWTSAAH